MVSTTVAMAQSSPEYRVRVAQNGSQGNKRVELEEPVYRPAPQLPKRLPEGADNTEPHKQNKKEYLSDSPDRCNSHQIVTQWIRGKALGFQSRKFPHRPVQLWL